MSCASTSGATQNHESGSADVEESLPEMKSVMVAVAGQRTVAITWAEQAIENGACAGQRRQERMEGTDRVCTGQTKIGELYAAISRNKNAG
jgi:hypothetical protein